MLLTLGMRVATRAARRMGNLDTVTTNVPGPQFPLYCCGRRLLRARPYVPLAAPLRVGVAIFSYDGEMSFGITGDYDTAPDIGVLATGISEGLAELLPTNGGVAGAYYFFPHVIWRPLVWLEARAAVQQRQGDDFDLKAFHRAALDLGSLGLDPLRAALERL